LEAGHIGPVWFGLAGQNLDENTAAWLQLPSTKGLLVTAVFDGTPAAKAGIASGDTIISVNDNIVTDHRHYVQLLKNLTKGEAVTLELMREGVVKNVHVRTEPYTEALAAQQLKSRWGMTLRKGKTYLVVDSVRQGSPAAKLGLKRGDLLVNISGRKVGDMKGLYQAFFTHRLDSSLILFVARDGKGYRVRMDI